MPSRTRLSKDESGGQFFDAPSPAVRFDADLTSVALSIDRARYLDIKAIRCEAFDETLTPLHQRHRVGQRCVEIEVVDSSAPPSR